MIQSLISTYLIEKHALLAFIQLFSKFLKQDLC